jgi:hypothetical protein
MWPLTDELGQMAQALDDAYNSRQMASALGTVQQAAMAGREAFPEVTAREVLAYPLAHLPYDTSRLQARLQATVDAVQAEQAAAAPAEIAHAPEVQQAPSPAEEGAAAVQRPRPVRPLSADTPTQLGVETVVAAVVGGLREPCPKGRAVRHPAGSIRRTAAVSRISTTSRLMASLMVAAGPSPQLSPTPPAPSDDTPPPPEQPEML